MINKTKYMVLISFFMVVIFDYTLVNSKEYNILDINGCAFKLGMYKETALNILKTKFDTYTNDDVLYIVIDKKSKKWLGTLKFKNNKLIDIKRTVIENTTSASKLVKTLTTLLNNEVKNDYVNINSSQTVLDDSILNIITLTCGNKQFTLSENCGRVELGESIYK